jgi:type II secretory pathway component PulF
MVQVAYIQFNISTTQTTPVVVVVVVVMVVNTEFVYVVPPFSKSVENQRSHVLIMANI